MDTNYLPVLVGCEDGVERRGRKLLLELFKFSKDLVRLSRIDCSPIPSEGLAVEVSQHNKKR